MKYKLNTYVNVNRYENTYFFVFGDYFSNKEKSITVDDKATSKMKELMTGQAFEEADLKKLFPEEMLGDFFRQKVLIPETLEQDQESVVSRNKSYFFINRLPEYSTAIQNKTVVVLGCGGIGTHVAWNLTALGIKKIVLVDYDLIEASNLNRQILYDKNDIGKLKADTLKNKLNSINHQVEIISVNENIQSKKQLKDLLSAHPCDLVIKSLDTPESFPYWLDKVCLDLALPYVSGITANTAPLIGPTFIPGESAGLSDFFPDNKEHALREAGISQSLGSVMYHISSEISLEVIRFFTNKENLKYRNKVVIEDVLMDQKLVLRPKNLKEESLKIVSTMTMAFLIVIMTSLTAVSGQFIFNIVAFLSASVLPLFFYNKINNLMKAMFFNVVAFGASSIFYSAITGALSLNFTFISTLFSVISILVMVSCLLVSSLNMLKTQLKRKGI